MYNGAQFQTFIYFYDGDRELCVSTARRHIQNLENLLSADAAGRMKDEG